MGSMPSTFIRRAGLRWNTEGMLCPRKLLNDSNVVPYGGRYRTFLLVRAPRDTFDPGRKP